MNESGIRTDRQLIVDTEITSLSSNSTLGCDVSEYLPRRITQRVVRHSEREGEIGLCVRLEEYVAGSPTTYRSIVNRVKDVHLNLPHINIEVIEVVNSVDYVSKKLLRLENSYVMTVL